MTDRKRPATQFIPIVVSPDDPPQAAPVAPPTAPVADTPAPRAPVSPVAPPADMPFAGRRPSQKTAQWRMKQSRYTGLMFTLVALFVILLVVAAAYVVFVGFGG
jgi:hypothetical protein